MLVVAYRSETEPDDTKCSRYSSASKSEGVFQCGIRSLIYILKNSTFEMVESSIKVLNDNTQKHEYISSLKTSNQGYFKKERGTL